MCSLQNSRLKHGVTWPRDTSVSSPCDILFSKRQRGRGVYKYWNYCSSVASACIIARRAWNGYDRTINEFCDSTTVCNKYAKWYLVHRKRPRNRKISVYQVGPYANYHGRKYNIPVYRPGDKTVNKMCVAPIALAHAQNNGEKKNLLNSNQRQAKRTATLLSGQLQGRKTHELAARSLRPNKRHDLWTVYLVRDLKSEIFVTT